MDLGLDEGEVLQFGMSVMLRTRFLRLPFVLTESPRPILRSITARHLNSSTEEVARVIHHKLALASHRQNHICAWLHLWDPELYATSRRIYLALVEYDLVTPMGA